MTIGRCEEFEPGKTTIVLQSTDAAGSAPPLPHSIQQNQGKNVVLPALPYDDGPHVPLIYRINSKQLDTQAKEYLVLFYFFFC